MSDISKINRSIDFDKGISLKKSDEVSKEKLREVADMYEQHFLKEMIKQMKSTVVNGEGLFKKNNAEKIFQEQLDDQYATQWNKQGSFGISNLIYNQLLERFNLSSEGDKPIEQPKMPIDLNENTKVDQLGNKDQFTLKIQNNSEVSHQKIFNPWAGTLQSKEFIEGDNTVYKIKHDNGLESLIMIQGSTDESTRFLSKGDQLQPGDSLGTAAKTSPLFWTVKVNQKTS